MKEILQKTLEQITRETGLVGGAIAVIRKGEIVFSHMYGYADRDAKRPITENSFFDIASCSKAFTTMLAAQACDKGTLEWDAPVRKYMPEFSMVDEYVANHITARDLASHRSGMPSHDFMRNKVTGDRRNLVMQTKGLELNTGFRSAYQYNNHMFIVLGYLLEVIENGKLWEDQILENITNPLGMTIRFRGPNPDMTGLDCALPYSSNGFASKRCGYASNNHTAPNGGIKTNIKDLCKWISAMSRGGEYGNGKRLCSKEQFTELTTPLIPTLEDMPPEQLNPCYALAWINSIYNGKRVIHHSGGLDGFNTQVGFLPDEDCGFAMIFNTGSTPAPKVIRAIVLDYLTRGEPKSDYTDMIEAWKTQRDKTVSQLGRYSDAVLLKPEDCRELIGVYSQPSYSEFDIVERDGGVWFEFGAFKAQLRREKDGRISGYTGTLDGLDAEFVELYPCDGGIKLHTSDSDLHIFFKKIK